MIEVCNLSKEYDGIKVLDNINFKTSSGEILGVIGRNGAGKSTLFKIICGLIIDYQGDSKVFGKKSNILLSHRISYLPEVRGLDIRNYVMDHLIELIMYKGYSKKDAKIYVSKWLKVFSLYDKKYSKIGSLSKGNQQKIQLIAAIAFEPDVLILDEPFSGLDLITIDLFWKVLIQLKNSGCNIVFSTHDLNDNLLYCDKFMFIDKGKIVKYGTLKQIQDDFSMILELKNKELTSEKLSKIIGYDNFIKKNGEFYITIKDESMAKKVYYSLDDKYCQKFYLRKMNIAEIFRKVSVNNGVKEKIT